MRQLLIFLIAFLIFHSSFSQIEVGTTAPEIELVNTKGEKVSLSSLKGKVVLIDFWASWCLPCRVANTSLVDIYLKYNSKGFEIYSISIDTEKDHWIKAIEKDQMPWEYHVSDLLGWKSEIPTKYGVEAIPAAFLLDKNGVVVEVDISVEDLEHELDKLLNFPVSVYPKNALNKLYFTQKVKFEVINEKGKAIIKGNEEEVDISNLTEGVYTVNFAGKTEKIFKKSSLDFVTFYPQNASKVLNLSKAAEYEIVNSAGKQIKTGNEAVVDISGLRPGLYYLNINGNTNKFLKK